jgi:hypothetical protein
MSVQASTWVWDHSRATGNTLLVLLAIADHASKDGRDAWPGQQRIAAKWRLSVRTVRRCIEELVELEELVLFKYGGPIMDGAAGRRTHRYALTMLKANRSSNSEEVVGRRVQRDVPRERDRQRVEEHRDQLQLRGLLELETAMHAL